MRMTVREAILTLNVNVVIACERAGFSSATVKMIEDALETIEDALKAQEPEAVDAPKPDSDIGCWYDITHNYTLEQVVSALKAQESPTSASISSAIECLLHPQDADDSDMAKAIDTAVRAMRLLKAQELGIRSVPIAHSDCGASNTKDARKKLGLQPKEVQNGH